MFATASEQKDHEQLIIANPSPSAKKQKFDLYAARGCTSLAPENSKEAFDSVDECNKVRRQQNPNSVEITGISANLILTKDKHLVCLHDDHILALTGVDKYASKMEKKEFAEIKMKAGSKQGTFIFFDEEFLKEYAGKKNLKIFIDIKTISCTTCSSEELATIAILVLNVVENFIKTKEYKTPEAEKEAWSQFVFNSSDNYMVKAICKEATKRDLMSKMRQTVGFDYTSLGKASKVPCLNTPIMCTYSFFVRKCEEAYRTGTSAVSGYFANAKFLKTLNPNERAIIIYDKTPEQMMSEHLDDYAKGNLCFV